MAEPYYSQLSRWAKAGAGALGARSLAEKLECLSPQEMLSIPEDPAQAAMLSVLVEDLAQELGQLCGPYTQEVCARPQGPGRVACEVQGVSSVLDLRGHLELLRLGVALELPPDPALATALVQEATRVLHKDLRGAFRVAARRSQRFASQGAASLRKAGAQAYADARRFEAAMCVLLGQASRVASRADLATDWLQGIDLWLHDPGQAPHRGVSLALSMTQSAKVSAAKAGKLGQAQLLWTPETLAARLKTQLQGDEPRAQAAWQALGQPLDPPSGAKAFAAAMRALIQGRAHPLARIDAALIRWLRAQA